MRLLNVGSGGPGIGLPSYYDGWEVVRLDADPNAKPDLLMDALDIGHLSEHSYDAVYSSHFLEHLYPSDLERFFVGVYRVTTDDGWCEVRVPDALAACKRAAFHNDLEAPCYESPAGTVTAWDILYGYLPFQMAQGKTMSHHNAFSQELLTGTLALYGFNQLYVTRGHFQLCAVGCKTDLPAEMKERIGIGRKRSTLYSDDGRTDMGAFRQFRAVAGVPLRITT